MCIKCGCGTNELRVEGEVHSHQFRASDPTSFDYYFRKMQHENPANLDTEPIIDQKRKVQIEQDVLSKNDQYAAENRQQFAAQHVLALNLLSSPGSGKTTLLTNTIIALRDRIPITVIEGDQQTSNDADRIRATGAKAIQINTGKGCHLDASMIQIAFARLAPPRKSIVMIENVGNLVCPASFDLGEAHKVVVLSVTEGEDKPLKYPDMFRAANLLLLNKIDLLPYLHFDIAQCIANARRVNPDIRILQLSANTGQGMVDWLAWIEKAFHNIVNRPVPVQVE